MPVPLHETVIQAEWHESDQAVFQELNRHFHLCHYLHTYTIRNPSPNQEKGATKPFEWCFSPQIRGLLHVVYMQYVIHIWGTINRINTTNYCALEWVKLCLLLTVLPIIYRSWETLRTNKCPSSKPWKKYQSCGKPANQTYSLRIHGLPLLTCPLSLGQGSQWSLQPSLGSMWWFAPGWLRRLGCFPGGCC